MNTYDLASAEAALTRAIELDPDCAVFRENMARFHILMGRPEEALSEARLALDLDPMSPSANAELARALMVNGRCEEALARLGTLIDLRPPILRAASIAAHCHAIHGRWEQAANELMVSWEDQASIGHALHAHILARAGRRDDALQALEGLLQRWSEGGEAFPVAIVYAGLGDLDEAIYWSDRSVDDFSLRLELLVQPLLADLRADPRFGDLALRLGVPGR